MLDCIKINDPSVDMCRVRIENIERILKGVEYLDLVASDSNQTCALALYTRINFAGRREAGIYFGPGPFCDDFDREEFRSELVRFFSFDEQCFEVARNLYYDLVCVQGFDYVEIPPAN